MSSSDLEWMGLIHQVYFIPIIAKAQMELPMKWASVSIHCDLPRFLGLLIRVLESASGNVDEQLDSTILTMTIRAFTFHLSTNLDWNGGVKYPYGDWKSSRWAMQGDFIETVPDFLICLHMRVIKPVKVPVRSEKVTVKSGTFSMELTCTRIRPESL